MGYIVATTFSLNSITHNSWTCRCHAQAINQSRLILPLKVCTTKTT